MVSELKRVYEVLRKRGLGYALGTFARRWKDELDIMYVFAMPLVKRAVDGTVDVQRTMDASVLTEFASERESEDADWRGGAYLEEIRRRFENGDWSFIARVDGKVVSIVSMTRSSSFISPVRHWMTIPPLTVGYYDVYTLASQRGKKIYTKLFNASVNACLADGFKTAWIWIMPHNTASLKAHGRLGMNQAFLEIRLRQKWGFRWKRVRPVTVRTDDILRAGGATS